MKLFSGFGRQEKGKRLARKETGGTFTQPAGPDPGNSAEPVKLTRKQRMQVRLRKVKTLPWYGAAGLAVLLLVLFCLTPFLTPRAYTPENAGGNKGQITLDFVGDVMLGRNVKEQGEASGYEKIFSNVTGFWSNADLVFANLESAVLKSKVSDYENIDKNIHLWADYTGLEAAVKAGINAFACANNHGFDYGEKAVLELAEYFRNEEIVYSGMGENIRDAASYRIIECNGVKIAFLSITEVYYGYAAATQSNGGILTLEYNEYNWQVYLASQEADITIVYIHWGEENETAVNDEQINLGHQLIDSGADIVIGSHPHVLQRIEKYGDGIIFYSLGNFVFDQANSWARDSVMVEYTADENGNGAFRLYPVRINDCMPFVTTNWFYKARINRELSQGLAKDSYYLDDDGFIVIPFDVTFDSTSDDEADDTLNDTLDDTLDSTSDDTLDGAADSTVSE